MSSSDGGSSDTEEPQSTRPISVAELLARHGTLGAPPAGGRRRRRRGKSNAVTVAELTAEIPVIRDEPPATEITDVQPAVEEVLSDATDAADVDEILEAEVSEADFETADLDEAPAEAEADEAEAEAEADEVDEAEAEAEADEVDEVDEAEAEAEADEVQAEAEADEVDEVEAEAEAEIDEAEAEAKVDEAEAEADEADAEAEVDEADEADEAEVDEAEAEAEDTEADEAEAEETAEAQEPEAPPLASDPVVRRGDGPPLSHDPRPVRRSSGAEQMSYDPVDESVDLSDLVDAAAGETEVLRSYLTASGGTLFSGETVADDLARRGVGAGMGDDIGTAVASPDGVPDAGKMGALRAAAVAAGQSVLAVLFGAGLFIGFDQLWRWNTIVALVLSVLVILGLVVAVRVVRRTEDIASTLIAVAVGALVTLGPLALLQSYG